MVRGLFKEPLSFKNEGETRQSRTNCRTCYEAPSESWSEIKKTVESHRAAREAILSKREKTAALVGASVPVEELIKSLKKLPKGSRVLITQSGYYAVGEFSDIGTTPEKVAESFYSIGHSSQSN